MTAAVLCFVFAAWPLIAFVGGAAFSPLTGIAALATSWASLPRFRFQFYMIALAAFLVLAAASVAWSPRPFVLFDFSSMSLRSEPLRWGLLMMAGGALIAAALQIGDRALERIVRVATIALLIQFLVVIGISIFEKPLIEFFYPGRPGHDGVQNITRNALNMIVTAPFLVLALTENKGRCFSILITAVALIAMVGVSILRDLEVGYLAMAASAVCYALFRFFGRSGFRILGASIALLVVAAPVVFQFVSAGANALTATNSLQYRQAIWHRVVEFIWEKPLLGSGVGALRMSREEISSGVFAGQLHIPNHPHNMLLQLWAETGAIGAALVAAIVVLVAWRLPRPDELGPATPRIAAIVGGFCASWVSFDLWNEAWWAVFCLLAVLTVIYFRRYAAPPHDEAPSVVVPSRRFGYSEDLKAFARVVMRSDISAVSDETSMSKSATPTRLANNFNLLRLGFALMVVAHHLVALMPGSSDVSGFGTSMLAEIGVQGFFVLSGYLVYSSFDRSSSVLQYAEKRIRRVYPAYAFVILVCAGVALLASQSAREDLLGVARYTGWNLLFANFMEPNLPGIFTHNPISAVNGALWTLKIEVMFYVVLPLLVWLLRQAGKFDWIVCLVIYIGAEAWRSGFTLMGQAEIARQLPGQMSFFLTGMMFSALQLSGWRLHTAGAVGALLFALSLVSPPAEFVRAVGLGAVAVWTATGFIRLPDAARFGDLSYGIYIVHFPIIQVSVVLGLFAAGVWVGTGFVVLASVVAAFIVWRLVEKPALMRDSAYLIPRS
ncbi:MAG: acyltransferase family protein [Hyphomonadaceae bacterium]|nr:acyltransferase family protein [Hyphomonadaceae bacterium]